MTLTHLKALVCAHKAQRPVVDKGAGTCIDPWPNLGATQTDPDTYFKVSDLLEGEQKSVLPDADSEQAVTLKTPSFSSLSLVLLIPDTLEHESKPGGDAKSDQGRAHDSTDVTP